VPGRQVVVGLPLAVILVAALVDRAPGPLFPLAAGLGLVGAVDWWWLAAEASTGRTTLVVDLADSTAPVRRALALITPDGMRAGPADDALLLVWAAAAAATAVAGYRLGAGPARRATRPPDGGRSSPVLPTQRSRRMWGLRSKP
ncbi:MAG: hypothetical protein ACK5RL_20625, partial [Acidimicrobiales bacterium]